MTSTRHFWHRFITTVVFVVFLLAPPPVEAGDQAKIYDSVPLGALAASARYDKILPEFAPCPQDFRSAQLVFDKPVISVAGVNKQSVRHALCSYLVLNRCDWTNNYSQSSAGVTGYLDLADHSRIRWLVRAGGLALLLYPDGGVVYLARELTTNWKTVADIPWAKVQVERRLYRKEGSKSLFVHILLTNTTNKEITFDAKDRASVFYPNQLVESSKTSRQLVDEIRPTQTQPSKAESDELIRSNNNRNLASTRSSVTIKPRDVYEYFISFNSGSKSDVEKTKAPYAIVVVDGNMTLTDGKTFEQLHRGPMDFHRCEVPLGTPIKLYTASKKANFLFED